MITQEFFDDLPKEGWLEREEADLLLKSASSTIGTILEVGCYHGKSTIVLATLNREVITVDSFRDFNDLDIDGKEAKRAFIGHILDRRIANVSLEHKRIENWVGVPIGFAFLDGDHTYEGTIRQIQVALTCGATEICVHDYDTNPKGDGIFIKKAIESTENLELIEVRHTMARCKVER